jgi:hypothetical protein
MGFAGRIRLVRKVNEPDVPVLKVAVGALVKASTVTRAANASAPTGRTYQVSILLLPVKSA